MDVAPYVADDIDQPWARTIATLTGKKIIEISLETGDFQTARKRWIAVSARIDTLTDRGLHHARRSGNPTAKPMMLPSLSADRASALARQTHHDTLAAGDTGWSDRTLPNGLKTPLQRKADAAAAQRPFAFANSFPVFNAIDARSPAFEAMQTHLIRFKCSLTDGIPHR